jgi:hypothetical protein
MGEMMKDTPKDCISKVFLEEKLFKTWYGGRAVLLGDGKPMELGIHCSLKHWNVQSYLPRTNDIALCSN